MNRLLHNIRIQAEMVMTMVQPNPHVQTLAVTVHHTMTDRLHYDKNQFIHQEVPLYIHLQDTIRMLCPMVKVITRPLLVTHMKADQHKPL